MIIIKLLLAFLLVGLASFGGGYAAIPLMEKELALRHGIINLPDLVNYITLAQVGPGPISVNASTLVGYQVGGVLVSLLATAAMLVCPIIVTLLLVGAWERVKGSERARRFLDGLKPVVVALVFMAAVRMAVHLPRDLVSAAILIAAAILASHPRIHPAWVIAGGVSAGAIYALVL